MLPSNSILRLTVRLAWLLALALAPATRLSYAGTVYYDTDSGDVFLDFDSPEIERVAGYQLDNNAANFIPANYRRLGGATDLFRTTSAQVVEGGGLAGGYAAGLYHLGPILEPGLADDVVTQDLFGVWAALGESTTRPLRIEVGRPTGVPLNEDGIQQVDRWAWQVTLSYFPVTGNLVLSSDGDAGGYMTFFRIEGDFTGTQATNPNSEARFDSGDNFVELIGLTAPGTFDLGPILSPNLSRSELQGALGLAVFTSQAGLGGNDIQVADRSPMLVAFIPEPGSSNLALCCCAAILAYCRSTIALH